MQNLTSLSAKMPAITIVFIFIFGYYSSFAQAPPGYYASTNGLNGTPLKIALHNIIKNHQARTYTQLWTDFVQTDKKVNGKVWDMYSDIPGGTPAYEYTFFTHQCGNYSAEGHCYNREHSWPASWFNSANPMYTDLFHIVPTDGWVNNKRANYPFGEVGVASWTSTNGSKLGNSISPGYTGIVFEPRNEYKGDFARGLMYMNMRYYSQDAGWAGSPMTTGAELLPWARVLLLKWHNNDPVSDKEIARNNAVYLLQNNRNPFIDQPEFAVRVFDPNVGVDENKTNATHLMVWPNPATRTVNFIYSAPISTSTLSFQITDVAGKTVMYLPAAAFNTVAQIDIEPLKPGFYFVNIIESNLVLKTAKLVKN